jgi:hypothetical protein
MWIFKLLGRVKPLPQYSHRKRAAGLASSFTEPLRDIVDPNAPMYGDEVKPAGMYGPGGKADPSGDHADDDERSRDG